MPVSEESGSSLPWFAEGAGLKERMVPLALVNLATPPSSRGEPRGQPKTTQSITTVVLAQNDHAGADLDAVVEVHDVLVGHANAAGRDRRADRLRFIRAVDAV